MSYPPGFGTTPDPNQWQPFQNPPGGYGPPPGMPGAPPQKKSRTGLIIGIVAAVILLVVGAGVAAVLLLWPKKEKPVKTSALSGVPLSKAEAGQVLGTGPMVPWPGAEDKVFTEFERDPVKVVDQDCAIGFPDDKDAHDGSGWTDVRVQYLQIPPAGDNADSDGNTDTQIIQSVVAYPDVDAAAKYVATTKPKWEKCANKEVNLTSTDSSDQSDNIWKNGPVSERDGVVIWSSTSTTSPQTCVEAMAARANLVIEVEDCYKTGGQDSSSALVSKIAEKINQAPRDKK